MCLLGGGAYKKTLSQDFAKVRVSFVWMVPYKIQLQMKYIGSVTNFEHSRFNT